MVDILQKKRDEPLNFLIFSASLRSGSLNTRLARLAEQVVVSNGGKVDFADMNQFECPSFNNDLERDGIIPEGANAFRQRLEASHGLIISSPEYNGSMPGNLKNALDWVSRFRPQPFNEHHALLMSASPSMAGGNRGLWALRVPFEHLGTRVFPNMFSLAMAHKAFNDDGTIADQLLSERFVKNIISFMMLVEAATHYPCMKKAWVEFLGEKPDPVTDRVE